MFIKTGNKEELMRELLKMGQDEEIVIHYNCSYCDDEQVSHLFCVEEEILTQIKEKNSLMVNLECSQCGRMEKFLNNDNIQGIETDF